MPRRSPWYYERCNRPNKRVRDWLFNRTAYKLFIWVIPIPNKQSITALRWIPPICKCINALSNKQSCTIVEMYMYMLKKAMEWWLCSPIQCLDVAILLIIKKTFFSLKWLGLELQVNLTWDIRVIIMIATNFEAQVNFPLSSYSQVNRFCTNDGESGSISDRDPGLNHERSELNNHRQNQNCFRRSAWEIFNAHTDFRKYRWV